MQGWRTCKLDSARFRRGDSPTVSRASSRSLSDPDLDHPVLPQAASVDSLADHQRLIANPSLAFLMWLISFVAIRHAVIEHKLGLFLIGLVLTMVPFLLVQFHCLDCGATGWALRAARHFCPAVAARCQGFRLWQAPHPSLADPIPDLAVRGGAGPAPLWHLRRLPSLRRRSPDGIAKSATGPLPNAFADLT